MKKISLFLLIILLVFLLSVPVFAAETYTYVFDSSNIFDVPLPTVGNYRYFCSVNTGLSFSGVSSVNTYVEDDLPFLLMPVSFTLVDDGVVVFDFSFVWAVIDGVSIAGVSTNLPPDEIVTLTIEKIESPGFIDSVKSGLSSVISWIQSFTLAFLSGELSPLLTVFVIGICVAALFFGVRSIYKICWGC